MCIHDLCFEQKKEKYHNFSSENYHFYSCEILHYIVWECYRNGEKTDFRILDQVQARLKSVYSATEASLEQFVKKLEVP